MEDSRYLKHELRTPMNHIVGYAALLLDSAEDADDRVLMQRAIEIERLARKLHVTIEGMLLRVEGLPGVEDIELILDVIAPLEAKVAEYPPSTGAAASLETFLKNLRPIEEAVQRLRLLLEGMSSSRAKEVPK